MNLFNVRALQCANSRLSKCTMKMLTLRRKYLQRKREDATDSQPENATGLENGNFVYWFFNRAISGFSIRRKKKTHFPYLPNGRFRRQQHGNILQIIDNDRRNIDERRIYQKKCSKEKQHVCVWTKDALMKDTDYCVFKKMQ